MVSKQEEFLKKLLEDFKIEAAEHRQSIVEGLLKLEKNQDEEKKPQIIEVIFREVHSLKGAARSVNLPNVERFCHAFETIVTLIKKGGIQLSRGLIDSLLTSTNILDILLARSADPLSTEETGKLSAIINHFERISTGDKPEPDPVILSAGIAENRIRGGTVRISTSKLNNLFLQAEELITSKLAGSQYAAELRDLQKRLGILTKTRFKQRKDDKYAPGHIQNVQENEFIEWQTFFVKSMERDINKLIMRMEQEFRTLGRVVDGLLGDMKKAMMFPVSSILDVMPKMVRDLAHDYGKMAELTIRGGETEIDRRILEEIKDPLMHIIRNCMDYGIEKPDVRLQTGKDASGILIIDVKQKDSRNVEIVISDDGAGIDIAEIRSAAVKSGLFTSETADKIPDDEALNFVFRSGISTSPIITDLSGRGIGLAIVQEKTEKLGGTVSVKSAPGAGTEFRLILPLVQATFRGIMVNSGNRIFIIPIQNVERVMRIKMNDIRTVENRNTIQLRENVLPLVRLDDVLGIQRKVETGAGSAMKPVLVLVYAGKHIAFMVDEVLGEQEGIIKKLGPQLRRVINIAGATISGSGSVIPIIDAGDLIETAIHQDADSAPSLSAEETEDVKHTILVAEDSITSRSLLQNILESAGYIVKTAVDGMDALAFLRGGEFDLLVSDIDMPRMNGFDLTLKIRSDKRLADLPVVLVTALDSRDDRERGIESGANAYIVKSSFDQSNLLEVVQRLI